jgi:hypothetical protein
MNESSSKRMSIRLIGSVLASLSLLAAAPAQGQNGGERFDMALLRPAVLEYTFKAQGNPVGRSTSTLSQDGPGWKSLLELQFGAVQQTITARWGADWAPADYAETYAGPFDGRADVKLENGRLTGSAAMPPQAGGNKTFDAATVPGAAWSMMDEVMLSTADLAEGKTFVIPVFNTSTGTVDPVTFTVGAVESVTVPAGTFQAYRVGATGGSSPLTMWLRADGPHILVRQELVRRPLVSELTAIR